jgi:hypothetical protein
VWLYDHSAQEDVQTQRNDASTPMYAASRMHHLHAVQFLHKNGAAQDINAPSWQQETPLWRACKEKLYIVVNPSQVHHQKQPSHLLVQPTQLSKQNVDN